MIVGWKAPGNISGSIKRDNKMYTISRTTKEVIDLNNFHLLRRGSNTYYSDSQGREYILEDIEELYSLSEIDLFKSKLKVVLSILPAIISATPQNSIIDNIKLANDYADEIIKQLFHQEAMNDSIHIQLD